MFLKVQILLENDLTKKEYFSQFCFNVADIDACYEYYSENGEKTDYTFIRFKSGYERVIVMPFNEFSDKFIKSRSVNFSIN